ncbi:cell division FtsZ family protein [Akkermansiaceae bacterium]|nr:cell division FtsZ family protein [Akkermansiaceae bacterium]MDC0266179.1 cell division FtsZ family protein [bacterium]MDC0291035.1 cell division FtsZ family protein [Akkermansiaceae bacterium]
MIDYPRNSQQTIPESSVKIVGLGGAGSNMLDRVALDGIEGAELLSLNTDVRTLNGTVAGEKIQLGRNLTKGLGTGGDPELGEKAILEAENEIRDSLRDRQIVFVCVGLGGGSGSGAAPVLVRLAREAGAFVVVFATMPFAFEGRRRRTQAEESLNQLAVLANALVTFDNGRMGELVLPKQGVHEAFSAADRMISDSITAVGRLVLRPGLINVGLDELISALKTTRSRCLFGSGLGRGENRAQSALKAALSSPLLDRGSLLEDATTVLVHICGGDDMTLYEVELLMQGLTKYIPENAHLLFGAATDKQMKDALSVTIISALPEDRLQAVPFVGEIEADDEPVAEEEALVIEPEPEPEPEPELADEVIGFIEEEPEGLEDEESEKSDDEKVDVELEEESLEEEDIDLESDNLDDFADPKLKEKSDKGEPEPPKEAELEIEVLGGSKASGNQGELLLEGAPKGRFDGESPNVDKDGEDLDVPPYLRKRGRRR